MAESGKKWYVLRAVSGKEAKVKEYIDAELKHNELLSTYVSQVLIPMEKYAVLRNGKRVVKEKISLPGYVLVEAELKGDVAHTLRFMPNVLGFLGGLDNPTPVKQSELPLHLFQQSAAPFQGCENTTQREKHAWQSRCRSCHTALGRDFEAMQKNAKKHAMGTLFAFTDCDAGSQQG